MASYIFQDLLSKAPMSIRNNVADARSWMQDNVTTVTTNRILTGDRQRQTDSVQPGRMYMFNYDPKTKDKLPYYDRFPLIFKVAQVKGGFTGLNMHYLPHRLRAKLMDALYDTTNNKKYDETTRLRMTYQTLQAATKYKWFKPTFKQYLTSQVRSRFIEVSPSEWDIALFLPVEAFEKSRKTSVWSDSRNAI